MSTHVSTERMNESLDGLLSAAETAELEAHLEGCGVCRNEHARLAETLRAIAALPREATPPEGAWAGVQARLERAGTAQADDEVPVYRLPTSGRAPRRLSLSIPEALAAGIAVAVVSAGLMWMAIGGGGGPEPRLAAPAGVGGAAARAVSLEETRYDEVVLRLERILEDGRGLLTPETLASIDESLATIDAAIEEIEGALASDPNSDLLRRMLASRQQTRLGVLERAAAAVQAQT